MATKGKKRPSPADDWEALPASHAPAEDWEDAANPSDARAQDSRSGLRKALAHGALTAIAPGAELLTGLFGGDPETVLAHGANSATLKNAEYVPGVKSYLDETARKNPGSAGYGSGSGTVAAGTGMAAAAPAGLTSLILSSGAMGLATKPDGDNGLAEDLANRGKQGAWSAALAGGLGIGAKGLGKAGDWLMQRAVGRNKYTPGVGTTLADEGIVGTQNQMRNQVGAAKDRAHQEMLRATSGNPAVYDSMPVAQGVMNLGRPKMVPGAAASALDQPYIDEVAGESLNIGSRGLETLSQMLRRRAAAGQRGWSSVTDQAKRGVNADISKAEQIAYSKILKNAAPELAPVDARYAALAKAAHGLKPEQRLSQSGNVMRPPTGFWDPLLNVLPSSLVESLLGQAMVKGAQTAPATIPAITSSATRQKGKP